MDHSTRLVGTVAAAATAEFRPFTPEVASTAPNVASGTTPSSPAAPEAAYQLATLKFDAGEHRAARSAARPHRRL